VLRLSVIIPTHNPDPGHLARTLAGLADQTLALAEWECLVIDNASRIPLANDTLPSPRPANTRVVRENTLGLTAARRCGFLAAQAPIVVLVDDDNVLDPDYLANVLAAFAQHPKVGALGGRSVPAFGTTPPAWVDEFFPLLALRDLGTAVQISAPALNAAGTLTDYPMCAPIGAGMALRREVATAWLQSLEQSQTHAISDRRGNELTSGGDNDIVLRALRDGWLVGYFPSLRLTHLIPQGRLQPDYLARLNEGIQRSWVRVLALHGIRSWPKIPRWTVPIRTLRAWFRTRAWQSPAARIRYHGLKGRFLGQADLQSLDSPV